MLLPEKKQKSKYLRAKDFQPNDMLKCIVYGEAEMGVINADEGDRERLNIPVMYGSEELTLAVGPANWDRLASMVGSSDTVDWVGYELDLLVVPYPKFNAQGFVVLSAVNVDAPETNQPAAKNKGGKK